MPHNPYRNRLWADLIIEELVRLGSDTFFVSPGLRSSPLVAAIGGNEKARPVVHFDERGSAFAALGCARATGTSAVWVTTSGTALANGLPAVVEASVDGIPLLLLTADRPPELRETGANQTIRQPGLFGDYVRWFFDLPTPTDHIEDAFVLTTVDQAVYRAISGRGPVHLNCMFREPLLPDGERDVAVDESNHVNRAVESWRSSNEPYTRYIGQKTGSSRHEDLSKKLERSKRPILLLGRQHGPEGTVRALKWASDNGIPVFPDILSGIRLGSDERPVAPYYDLLLASKRFRTSHMPDALVQIGRQPVSKRLQNLITEAHLDPFVVLVDGPERIDPSHRVTHRIEYSVELPEALFSEGGVSVDPESGWLDDWTRGSRAIGDALAHRFERDGYEALTEQELAYHLCRELPANHFLTLASSLPVRHVDTFGFAGGNRATTVANRGASGIDGTIATAAGVAQGTLSRGTVLLGDQALLHDLNSLALAARSGIVVIVINNNGGGIFSYLPIVEQKPIFETFFAAPHDLSFEAAARLFGLAYENPASASEFVDAYSLARTREGASLIEVKTDRADTHANHLHLLTDLENVIDSVSR